jgi:hypothetical protein
MLQFDSSGAGAGSVSSAGDDSLVPWKILIYDSFCQDLLSPIINVQELRKKGITLHM